MFGKSGTLFDGCVPKVCECGQASTQVPRSHGPAFRRNAGVNPAMLGSHLPDHSTGIVLAKLGWIA